MQCLKFDTHTMWQIWSMGWFYIWECGHWCWMPPLDRERINRVRGANWPDTGDNQDEDGNSMVMVRMVSLMRWRWMMVRMMNLLPPTSATHLLLSRSQAVNPPRFPNNIVRRRNRNCDQKRFRILSGQVCNKQIRVFSSVNTKWTKINESIFWKWQNVQIHTNSNTQIQKRQIQVWHGPNYRVWVRNHH